MIYEAVTLSTAEILPVCAARARVGDANFLVFACFAAVVVRFQ